MKDKDIILEAHDCAHCALKVEKDASSASSHDTTVLWPRRALLESFLSVMFFAAAFIVTGIFPAPVFLFPLLMAAAGLVAGYRIMLDGMRSLFKLRLNEDSLMTIAVIAAFIIGEYSEAALVAILFRIGELFEQRAVEKSRKDISRLADIRPDTVRLAEAFRDSAGGDYTAGSVLDASLVPVSTLIAVHPYERIPLDGVVVKGESSIDASALSGESLPVEAGEGTQLLSGMMNLQGTLVLRTSNVLEDSAASRVLALVESAQAKKARSEKFISRFAGIYTPLVVSAAILLAAVPPLLGFGAFEQWLYRALVFLVASCPCALVISVPLGFFAGIGAVSKRGVLVKGGNYLEALSKTDTFVFDKTGTLTTGKLSVTDIISYGACKKEELLRYAASLEQYSSHPLAKALMEAAGKESLVPAESSDELRGLGMSGLIEGHRIVLGRASLLIEQGIPVSEDVQASIYIAIDGTLAGAFNLADTIRSDAAETVAGLHTLGIKKTVILSGDSEQAVSRTARALGIDEYRASLLPEEKLKAMEELGAASRVTSYVGDGINDAPVLAAADCGIAMGLGSEAAIEAADIVLSLDKPSMLVHAIATARRSMRIIRFNIAFALGIKALVLVAAALGYAPMWAAVFADTGVAVLTVLNAARILAPGQIGRPAGQKTV